MSRYVRTRDIKKAARSCSSISDNDFNAGNIGGSSSVRYQNIEPIAEDEEYRDFSITSSSIPRQRNPAGGPSTATTTTTQHQASSLRNRGTPPRRDSAPQVQQYHTLDPATYGKQYHNTRFNQNLDRMDNQSVASSSFISGLHGGTSTRGRTRLKTTLVIGDSESDEDDFNNNSLSIRGATASTRRTIKRVAAAAYDDTTSLSSIVTRNANATRAKISRTVDNKNVNIFNHVLHWYKLPEKQTSKSRNKYCRIIADFKYWILTIIFLLFLLLLKSHLNEKLSLQIYAWALGNFMKFTEGSQLTRQLQNAQPMLFRLNVWNITNPEAANNGEPPKVEEIGPYVYNMKSELVDLRFDSIKHSTFFKRKMIFNFNKEETVRLHNLKIENNLKKGITISKPVPNPDTDKVYHANIPAILISRILGNIDNYWLRLSAGLALAAAEVPMNPVTNSTVKGLLEGVDDGILKAIKTFLSTYIGGDELNALPNQMGLLTMLNNTDSASALMEVDDGTLDIRNVMKIKSIDNSTVADCWYHDDLSPEMKENLKLQANDGIFYPPLTDYENPPQKITVYSDETRRTVDVQLIEKSETNGLPTLKYMYGNDTRNPDFDKKLKELCSFAANDTDHPDHCKYSKGSVYLNKCMPIAGLLPPILMSNPHFLHSTGEQVDHVEGYAADFEKHGSFVVFEPRTGIPVTVARRMQVSVVVHKQDKVDQFANLQDETTLPIVWIDFLMDDPKISLLLKNFVHIPSLIIDKVPFGLILLTIVTVCYCIKSDYHFELRSKDSSTPYQDYTHRSGPLLTIAENSDDDTSQSTDTITPIDQLIEGNLSQEEHDTIRRRNAESTSTIPPPIPPRVTAPNTQDNKTRAQRSLSTERMPRHPPPRRPTNLNIAFNNNLRKPQGEPVTTPGLHYTLKHKFSNFNTLKSDTESVSSVIGSMIGNVFNDSVGYVSNMARGLTTPTGTAFDFAYSRVGADDAVTPLFGGGDDDDDGDMHVDEICDGQRTPTNNDTPGRKRGLSDSGLLDRSKRD